MFILNLLSIFLPLITAIKFDFSLNYRLEDDPRPRRFLAGSIIPEDLENATEISLDQKVPIVLRSFDLSFVKNLKKLSMDDSGINEIEIGSFKHLDGLRYLNITNNPLKVIKEGIFNNMKVEVLNLSRNKLTTINPGAFDDMENLQRVILDYNELTSYSIWFKSCSKLVEVSVQYNFIQYLPQGVFQYLKHRKLKARFSFNKINTIHEDLFDVEEYDELDIDHNDLTNFDKEISKVGILNLQHNHIECLPEDYAKKEFKKVKTVRLEDNPMNCSCLGYLKAMANVVASGCVENEHTSI
ncbi:chondroadherin-like [Diorhabda carinulata]|uniref:chondroadherin-like n=1 Tax=Diorhabda carinulata TaxID=1163345 RepID=UPI0025A2B14C|nr:chondroadherin-like [Diorhabda carinulata]